MYTLILPNAARSSEFGFGYNGDCVETAMAVAVGIVTQHDATPQSITAIVKSMQGKGIASSNGATSINNAHDWLQSQGYTIAAYVGYSEPFNGDWLGLLRQWAGLAPIVLNVANAQALTDTETGAHDEVGVHYHGLCICGKQSDGYVAVDGDNPQARDRYQVYTRQTIAAAQPCGMIVLAMPQGTPSQPTTGGTPMPTTTIPQDWQLHGPDANHNIDYLLSPAGIEVEGHIASYIINHPWPAYDQPLMEWTGNGENGGYEQLFGYSKWGVHPNGTVYQAPVGQQFLAATGTIATQAAQITSLQAQIVDLHTQLAAVQTQPLSSVQSDPQEHALAQAVLDLVNVKIIQHNQAAQGGATQSCTA